MRFLPIVDRELRVASRRPKTYRARVVAALVAVAFAAYFFWIFFHFPSGTAAGRQVFTMLTQFTFVYCLFAGVGTTADSLTREKREGTMGLLFLTQLKPYDVVLGKLLSSSLQAVYGVVATVPASALCLIVGGVQAGEFWRMVLALLNTLFFSLSAGLFVSSICRQERKAVQAAADVAVLFGFVFPGVGEWLRLKTNAVELSLFLKLLSPAETLDFSTIPTASVKYFWWSLLAVHLLAWLLLGSACSILPRAWQDKAGGNKTSPWRERWQSGLMGSPARRHALRLRLLDRNPFYWLAARTRSLMLETWIILGGIIAAACWAGWFFHAIIPVFVVCVITVALQHAVLRGQFCAAACERLATDKQNGTLELLLGTPLGVRAILRGQWLALARQFTGPLAAVVVLDVLILLIALAFREPDFFQAPESTENCLLALIAATVMLAADTVALGWVGMWQALAAKHVMPARSRTLILVLFVPWIVLFLGVSVGAVLSTQYAWMRELNFWHFLGAWFSLGVLNDLLLILWARKELSTRFRILASVQYRPAKHGWFGWFDRSGGLSIPASPASELPQAS